MLLYICRMTLLERDKHFIWHPFTPQKNMPSPLAITHGKGTLLFDENGRIYRCHQQLVGYHSWSCASLHCGTLVRAGIDSWSR